MKPEEIKAIRQKLGLSQRGLAEKINCPQSTIGRWETGVHPISNAYAQLLKQLKPE